MKRQKTGLSVICNDAALPGKGVGKLFDASLVSRLTATHIGLNPKAQQQMLTNEIEVDLVPCSAASKSTRRAASPTG